MKIQQFKTDFGGRTLLVEAGKYAGQANGSVRVQYGDTTVLVTATMSKHPGGSHYFPLSLHYEERFSAAGKIKGSRWIKRETRPSDDAILTMRLIDRTLRPRFDHRIRHEVQVVATVLSFDQINDPDIPAMIGASLALMISDIPFDGPVAGCRVGKKDGTYILNPSYSDRLEGTLDIIVAGSEKHINMLDGSIKIVPEKEVLEAIVFGQQQLKKIIEFQNKITKSIGKAKQDIAPEKSEETFQKIVKDFLDNKLEKAIYKLEKKDMADAINGLKQELHEHLEAMQENDEQFTPRFAQADEIFEEEIDSIIHKNILEREKRPDGRKLDELRSLWVETSVLPRTHGSGLFNRGVTQALSILTLAEPGAEQWIETMEITEKKRYFHHYNFPPYSSGETGRIGFTNRREVGHGALAEKALVPVLPSKEDFPYTMRVVTEILSSNGSTSMAAVCGSTLALMDGGVPITEPVAGIAMGLITSRDGNKFKILTDIQGPEDHHGDMDLKIAGTRGGLTAIQMDVKVDGVTIEILEKTFAQSKKARHEILAVMKKLIAAPRKELSPFAPRIFTIKIHPDKIRLVIGPQGKIINEIIETTGVAIDIEDDGLVFITAPDQESAQKAMSRIKDLTKEVKVGELFDGIVKKITDFGAFIEVAPGQEGLLHISQISEKRIDKVTDILHLKDKVTVKVRDIDANGRISLTMKF